uniref:Gustatory receptor n=1 Tax=Strigamia maritima TaxID=126957 RepID=T1IZT5_STRMM
MILHPRTWKCLNILYITFVTLNIIYSNVYETVFCEGQVATYTQAVPLKTTTTNDKPTTVHSNNGDDWWPHHYDLTTATLDADQPKKTVALCHELTIYAIPNTLHVLAFIIGFWYFRIKENEELDALMETIFLQAHYMFGAQEKLIRNSKLFLCAGMVWIALILIVSGLSIAAYGIPELIFQKFNIRLSGLIISLASIQFLGKVYVSCTYIALIVNYSIQCEFITWAIKSICLQLHERNLNLKDLMHEILRLKQLISKVNGSLSKLASLCVTNFALKVIIGFSILITTDQECAFGWIYRIMFPLVWAPVMMFPLIQAARVTKTGEKLRQIACELRVFGYKDSDLCDLDSLILFVSSAKLRAKLFSMPIKPSYLISTFAVISFVLLLLFQTNVIRTTL